LAVIILEFNKCAAFSADHKWMHRREKGPEVMSCFAIRKGSQAD
jgi:hypothetical protein